MRRDKKMVRISWLVGLRDFTRYVSRRVQAAFIRSLPVTASAVTVSPVTFHDVLPFRPFHRPAPVALEVCPCEMRATGSRPCRPCQNQRQRELYAIRMGRPIRSYIRRAA